MDRFSTILKVLRRSRLLLVFYKYIFRFIGLLPRSQNLVIFESFHGKQYSDNPRAIFEYMLDNYPQYKLVWSADRRCLDLFEKRNVEYVKRFSLKWLLLMGRAKYWVINSRLPLWIPKPKKTVYLQTWHGTPLKKLGVDIEEVMMPGTNTKKYRENFLFEAKKWDYLVSPNKYSTKLFQHAFDFKKEVIETGYPRNDFLINSNTISLINELKKRENLPVEKKVILYAPTWRDNEYYEKGRYKFNLQMDLDLLKESIGDEYVIILRLHYLVEGNVDLTKYEGFVYDMSRYEDIRELYLMADMLITDYSSVFFDYANLKRPMLFFVYDIEEYRDNLRGFYLDFEKEAPGPFVKNTQEIITEINNISRSDFELSDKAKEFYDRFCYLEDGNASKRVIQMIFPD